MANLLQIILAGFLASIIWFLVSTVLYLNQKVIRLYQKAEKKLAVRWWNNARERIRLNYVNILIQSILAAAVFNFIRNSLGITDVAIVFHFSLIIVLVKLIPRFLDMWLETNYPLKLLILELIDDSVCAVLISSLYVFLL